LQKISFEAVESAEQIIFLSDTSDRKFQAKFWAGCNSENAGSREFEDGKTQCLIAYIRSNNNVIDITGYPEDHDEYQLQYWRNIDATGVYYPLPEPPEGSGDKKWKLHSMKESGNDSMYHYSGINVRRPLENVGSGEQLKFNINTDKFAPGEYQYMVISLDKLEEKLHLMSKYGLEDPDPSIPLPYNHIEDNLLNDSVFSDLDFDNDDIPPGFNDSPIVAQGTLPTTGLYQIAVNLTYPDPESSNYPNDLKEMSDFILVIKP
jgi:hypothetical protein